MCSASASRAAAAAFSALAARAAADGKTGFVQHIQRHAGRGCRQGPAPLKGGPAPGRCLLPETPGNARRRLRSAATDTAGGQSRALPSHWHRQHRGPAGKSLSYSAGRNILSEKTLSVMVSLPGKGVQQDVGGGLLDVLPVGGIPQRRQRRGGTGRPELRPHGLGDVVHKGKQTGGVPQGAASTRMVSSAKQFKNTSLPTVRLPLPTVSRRRLRQL